MAVLPFTKQRAGRAIAARAARVPDNNMENPMRHESQSYAFEEQHTKTGRIRPGGRLAVASMNADMADVSRHFDALDPLLRTKRVWLEQFDATRGRWLASTNKDWVKKGAKVWVNLAKKFPQLYRVAYLDGDRVYLVDAARAQV